MTATPAHLLIMDVGKSTLRGRVARWDGRRPRWLGDALRAPNSREGFGALRDFAARLLGQLEATHGLAGVSAAVLCVPGTVSGDRRRCTLDYLDAARWFDVAQELAGLGVGACAVLNDAEAAVWGIRGAAPQSLVPLCGTGRPSDGPGPMLVVVPGSGLGVGIGLPGGRTLLSCAGELHFNVFADRPEEVALFQRLVRGRCQRSYESVVSGKGIVTILGHLIARDGTNRHAALRARVDAADEPDRARLISQVARRDRPAPDAAGRALCRHAMGLFVRFLGRFLQNLCLILRPRAVYLGGAIVNGNAALVRDELPGHFQTHYRREYFAAVPVLLSTDADLNLTGAAHWAGEHMADLAE